jgi:GlcNAc-PI de-N-acetylase
MEKLMKEKILFFSLFFLLLNASVQAQERVEQWKGKTIMVFTPHPDDDLFGCGGTLALLAKNGNKIIIVIYTNDNKGSFDLEMTSERLARFQRRTSIGWATMMVSLNTLSQKRSVDRRPG